MGAQQQDQRGHAQPGDQHHDHHLGDAHRRHAAPQRLAEADHQHSGGQPSRHGRRAAGQAQVTGGRRQRLHGELSRKRPVEHNGDAESVRSRIAARDRHQRTVRGTRLPLLIAAVGVATVARAALGAPTPAASVPAAIVFCAILLAAPAATRAPVPAGPARAGVAFGAAGGTALVLASFAGLPTVTAGLHAAPSTLLWWLPLVALVAAAEELMLRGALFTALEAWHGDAVAVAVSAALFAAIHLPLYGLGAMPIDLAVGVFLGGLRVAGGGVTAPLLAHILADVATAWLP